MDTTGLAHDVKLTVLTSEQIQRLDVHTTDAYLNHTREVFLRADRRGPEGEADALQAYIQLDLLLDHRLQLPLPRLDPGHPWLP